VHVTEAAFKDPPLLPQDHEGASHIAVHVFCAAYITFEEDTGVDIGWCDSCLERHFAPRWEADPGGTKQDGGGRTTRNERLPSHGATRTGE
jgi:hypothetical protein